MTEKIAEFRERGIVASYREGMFLPASWLAVYYGQRIMPDRVNPLIADMPMATSHAHVAKVAAACASAAKAMPLHEDYIARIKAAA
uniref:tryptophan 7-halogenase n=1 Tax=Sphingomonas sp. H160509 TaxID=2955313 RepID=UPI003158AFA2